MFKILSLFFIFSSGMAAGSEPLAPCNCGKPLSLSEVQSYYAQVQPFILPGCTEGQTLISGSIEEGLWTDGGYRYITLNFDGGAIVSFRSSAIGSTAQGTYEKSSFGVYCISL